ncbi:DUF3732 domain-containing protein [Candidatus Thiosymbion oneisti]|uniref:DUF3732 domain-containing protein n=1 Tax=Candidatus Thiosymbion oneisti TaxID=589554 RepID=UPI00159F33E4|nr:DUF3732 domain-containing protein [Candidatus Thiosymbion oneisti]
MEQREAADQVWRDASDFQQTTERQARRIEAVNLLKEETDTSHCPFCEAPLDESTEPVERLRESLEILRTELEDVDLERPRINRHIEELREREVELGETIKRLRLQIEAAVSEDDALRADEDLDGRRSRLAGSAETLLEALPTDAQPGEATKIAELREEITSLAAELDPQGKEQALDAMRLHIGRMATKYLRRLPFAAEYHEAEADLNLKTLQAGIAVESRYIPMRSIGSDENYLSMHVSFALALQKVLSERGRPVPGLIVFDQISRPYFPADRYETVVDVASVAEEKRGESEKLKQYFDLLFDEIERATSLQIIVLEHAYFSDDERFRQATREQWPSGRGLVPADWPASMP